MGQRRGLLESQGGALPLEFNGWVVFTLANQIYGSIHSLHFISLRLSASWFCSNFQMGDEMLLDMCNIYVLYYFRGFSKLMSMFMFVTGSSLESWNLLKVHIINQNHMSFLCFLYKRTSFKTDQNTILLTIRISAKQAKLGCLWFESCLLKCWNVTLKMWQCAAGLVTI